MRPRNLVLIFVGLLLVVPGCQRPKGVTTAQKRAHVREMREETLASFYEANPRLRQKVANARGYAVFTNVSLKILMVATGNGYGIAYDRKTGRDTFMQMFEGGGGVGMGLKDMRALFIFHDRSALLNFIESGLEVGGQAEAAAKTDDVGVAAGTQVTGSERGAAASGGGAASGTLSEAAGQGYSVYRLTEAGAAASATFQGARYWKDDSLN